MLLAMGCGKIDFINEEPGDKPGEINTVNKPPTCTITNPQDNANFSMDESITVMVEAEDSDGTIAEVQLYIDDVEHSLKTAPPYNFVINAGELNPGAHILKAVAKDNEDAKGEAAANIVVDQPSTENPDFVSFSDGKIPNTWQTTAWYIDDTSGFDDLYSLKTTINYVDVIASKTCASNINFVEFYLRGNGNVDFLIDGEKRKICTLTNSWVRHGFYIGEGLHSFKWEFTDGREANLDAIRFKSETQLAVGLYYQGGIIAYLDDTNLHGLIAAPEDQSTGIQWYDGNSIVTDATGTTIGTGQSNTKAIVQAQGLGAYAAKLCDDLVLNGYSDWYLPSKDELNMLYQNRHLIGGLSDAYYWSSSENTNSIYAWCQYFANGGQTNVNKNFICRVRAVRTF